MTYVRSDSAAEYYIYYNPLRRERIHVTARAHHTHRTESDMGRDCDDVGAVMAYIPAGTRCCTWSMNVVIFKMAVSLDRMERDVILEWRAYCVDESLPLCGAPIVDPQEQAIVRTLTDTPLDRRCVFTEEQILMIRGWMEKAIARKYGPARYVTPAEQSVYDKISSYAIVPQEALVNDQ